MPDTYRHTQPDEPRGSLCDRLGHDYVEVGRRMRTWTETDTSGGHFEDVPVAGSNGVQEQWIPGGAAKTKYAVDVINYRCSRSGCGDRTEREENQRQI
jgi:hypothetical protein